MKSLVKVAATIVAIACFTVTPPRAQSLPEPEGRTLLVVTGNITHTNHDGEARFDRSMLEALPGRVATMETPWTKGIVTFEGPFLRALLDRVGASGSTLAIHALNDYSAEVPLSDAYDLDTILALKKNDEYMSVRDKGPLFLIYPFDKDTSLYNEKYFVRSVWQIRKIEVVR